VIVVDVPVEVAVERLMATRGYSEEEAGARIRAQAGREERRAIADVVIDNSGDVDHLRAEVERAWAWIRELQPPI
jgi:dephospho-CoA kinase